MSDREQLSASDTPRTDAVAFRLVGTSLGYLVPADFARQIERELADLRLGRSDDFLKHQHELCDLRAALRREENARKVLMDEVDRHKRRADENAQLATRYANELRKYR
jgi:hypothetical protein